MRKEVKPKTVCEHCGHTLTWEEYEKFCDYCQKKIVNGETIRITVFFDHHSSQPFEFCKYECAFKWLKRWNETGEPINKDTVSFIDLPYISKMGKDTSFAKELSAFIKAIENEPQEKGTKS